MTLPHQHYIRTHVDLRNPQQKPVDTQCTFHFHNGSPPNTVINLRSCLLHQLGKTFLLSTVEVKKDIERLDCGANVACVHQGINAMSPGCKGISFFETNNMLLVREGKDKRRVHISTFTWWKVYH